MFRRSVLIVSFVFSIPVLWSALIDQSVSLEAAGIRFLIAVPIAAVLVGLVRLAAHTPEPESGASGADSAEHDAPGGHTPAAAP